MNPLIVLAVVLFAGAVAAQETPDAGPAPEEVAAPPADVPAEPIRALAPQPVAAPAVAEPSPAPAVGKDEGTVVKAGFGEGFTVQHGPFRFNLRGRMQLQGFAVVPTEDSSAHRANGFMIRRARLVLKTELPYELSLNLQLAFSNQDMEPDMPNVLRDFYGEWRRFRDVSVRFGQGKVPYGVQRVISSSAQQFVDRSVVVAEFNLDRDVGVTLFSDDLLGLGGRLQYALSVFGGDGRNRIGLNQGLLYVARLRVSPFGKFDEKWEGDPDRSDRLRLGLGGGVAYNVMTNRPRSTINTPYVANTFDYFHAGADLVFKWKGFSVASEFFWRQADALSKTGMYKDMSVTEYSRPGWGWFAQAGYYVLPWLELGARYGDARPFGGADPKFARTREIGGTLNFMVKKHDLKLQVDSFWLDDGNFGDGRYQLRAQAQIFF
ncbi:MAG: porin [Myxococcota bacterium]